MESDRPHIIWMPGIVSGKIRSFSVNPVLIKVFFLVVLLCVFSVPFLETELISLKEKVFELESQNNELSSEITALQFVRNNLARIENKEAALKEYFGLESFSSLDQIAGTGGSPGDFISRCEQPVKNAGSSDVRAVSAEKYLSLKLDTLDNNYSILSGLLAEEEKIREFTPSIVPLESENPRVSSVFGWRQNPFTGGKEFHAGIDFAGTRNTKIIAPAAGVVVKKGYDKWLGNFLVIYHGETLKTIYGHLNKIIVAEGDNVLRGDLVGLMGNTGLSTNNHLHYSVVRGSQAVDPMEYILDFREG